MKRSEGTKRGAGTYTLTYILGLLLFGSNGIVASHIDMNCYEIVFYKTENLQRFIDKVPPSTRMAKQNAASEEAAHRLSQFRTIIV